MAGLAADAGIMNFVDYGRHLLGYGDPRYHPYLTLRMPCDGNCSGHGQCLNGSCYCMIQYQVRTHGMYMEHCCRVTVPGLRL